MWSAERRSDLGQRVASAVVKLGGSVITDKAGGSLTVREEVVSRLAAELRATPAGLMRQCLDLVVELVFQ